MNATAAQTPTVNKNNTSIIENKGINDNPIYNIGKKGQETLKTAYGIQGIAKGYHESITS